MNRLELLRNSYCIVSQYDCPPQSRLDYIGRYIFDFTTYDSEMSELFAEKAIEASDAISSRTTFDYIENEENYKWYLLMLNMPFFVNKIEWGGSIRGAWWNYEITFSSCGLWLGNDQIADDLKFTGGQWVEFMSAVSQFSKEEGQ